jgi:hypothetical protein
MFRSADGKMRVDTGATSVITDPASQKALVLDHIKKEARMVPIPQAPAPGMPPLPGALPAGMPKPPQVEDLGKGFIEGHEVDGKKYTFHPPDKPPALPTPPGLAKPATPGMPGMPQSPPKPTVAEVWTSASTMMPVLTKITGPFGQQVCHCKPGAAGAPPPHPAMFQVPPDYKLT